MEAGLSYFANTGGPLYQWILMHGFDPTWMAMATHVESLKKNISEIVWVRRTESVLYCWLEKVPAVDVKSYCWGKTLDGVSWCLWNWGQSGATWLWLPLCGSWWQQSTRRERRMRQARGRKDCCLWWRVAVRKELILGRLYPCVHRCVCECLPYCTAALCLWSVHVFSKHLPASLPFPLELFNTKNNYLQENIPKLIYM